MPEVTPALQTLLLLRHASAERGPAGGRDVDRRLSALGRSEAAGVGNHLRSSGLHVDHVLCSPAARTRETLEQLGLEPAPTGPDVVLEPSLYQASAAEVLELVEQAAATTDGTILVVGHAPAVPTAVAVLAGPGSAPSAAAAVATRYPPGTLAVLAVHVGPRRLQGATLLEVRLPRGGDGDIHR